MIRLLASFFALLISAEGLLAEGRLRVVTTLSSYAAITKAIGAEAVQVDSIASPKFNPHFIEARPSDVLKLKRCDLFIHSGLDLEAWRDPLVDAAARADIRQGGQRQLNLSLQIQLLEIPVVKPTRAEGDIHLFGNPHYWLDPRNGIIIARAIADKLSELAPENAPLFATNLDAFVKHLEVKIAVWQAQTASHRGAVLIGYHNEWSYLMNFLGYTMNYFLEPKAGVPPSPRSIEATIAKIKSEKIPAIVQSSYFSKDAAEAVSEATGAKVVVLAQNVNELPGTEDYVSFIDYNVRSLLAVLP